MVLDFFKHYSNFLNYYSLDIREKDVTIYSENKNYWPYLKEILFGLLEDNHLSICYVTSDFNDPGLLVNNKNLKKFCIGNGHIREIFFRTLDTKIILMTMPDLNNFQIKKSKNIINYVYVQHSLNSLHMAYREGAFNHFDTVVCAGEHHLREMIEIEKYYKLEPKLKLKYRYYPIHSLKEKLNNLFNESKKILKKQY